MKIRRLIPFAAAALVAMLYSCDPASTDDPKKEPEAKPEMPTAPVVVTGASEIVSSAIADLNFTVNFASAGKYTSFNAGVCLGRDSNAPTREKDINIAIALSSDKSGTYKLRASGLEAETKYYYRAWAEFDGKVSYGEAKDFTTPALRLISDPQVDLGLSVKWASCNVGATKPEEKGDLFAWGETTPKTNFSESTYRFGRAGRYYKYTTESAGGYIKDGRSVLMACDDAASVNCGSKWRMPTIAEKHELLTNTEHKIITYNGVRGYLFTSKKNGESIFFPFTGEGIGGEIQRGNDLCGFWTSELCNTDHMKARIACNIIAGGGILETAGFSMDGLSDTYNLTSFRYYGFPVRPVYAESRTEPYTVTTSNPLRVGLADVSIQVGISPSPSSSDIEEVGAVWTNHNETDMPELLLGWAINTVSPGKDLYMGDIKFEPDFVYYRAHMRVRAYVRIKGVVYYGNTVEFNLPNP